MTYAGVKGRGTGGSVSSFAHVFNCLGKYQPYGVYVPDAPGPYGLQMEWHGSNQGIVAQINQPGMQSDFGDCWSPRWRAARTATAPTSPSATCST